MVLKMQQDIEGMKALLNFMWNDKKIEAELNETLRRDNEELKKDNEIMKEEITKIQEEESVFRSANMLPHKQSFVQDTLSNLQMNSDEVSDEERNVAIFSSRKYSLSLNDMLHIFENRDALRKASESDAVNNTGTIHIYSILYLYISRSSPSFNTKAKAWGMAFVSLLVVSMQILIMFPLVIESSTISCAKHSDCRSGQFCQGFDENDSMWRHPRCKDCLHSDIFSDEDNEVCDARLFKNAEFDAIVSNLWYDTNFTPFININIDGFENNFPHKCMAETYCRKTSPAWKPGLKNKDKEDKCAFLDLTMARAGPSEKLIFFFVTVLFAATLIDDIKEAAIENKILQYVTMSIHGQDILWIPSFLIRLSNRIRRFILPWTTAAAGVGIILTGSFAVQNVVLNLMAVIFINESDNLFANLFMSPTGKAMGDELVKMVKKTAKISYSYGGAQSYGFLVSSVLFACTIAIQPLTLLFRINGAQCLGQLYLIMLGFGFFMPILIIVLRLIYVYFDSGEDHLIRSLLELADLTSALFYAALMRLSSLSFVRKSERPVPFLLPLLGIFCDVIARARLESILQDPEKDQPNRKEIVFNVITGIAWISIVVLCLFFSIMMTYRFIEDIE